VCAQEQQRCGAEGGDLLGHHREAGMQLARDARITSVGRRAGDQQLGKGHAGE
jgi:hypothetical protein